MMEDFRLWDNRWDIFAVIFIMFIAIVILLTANVTLKEKLKTSNQQLKQQTESTDKIFNDLSACNNNAKFSLFQRVLNTYCMEKGYSVFKWDLDGNKAYCVRANGQFILLDLPTETGVIHNEQI